MPWTRSARTTARPPGWLAGWLALLAAAGSHLVTDFLARGHDDRALVEVTAWGSMAAARGVGDRLRRELTGTSLG